MGRALFITWNLHGSLPASRFPKPSKWSSGETFVWADRYLDTTRAGPLWLRVNRIARMVVEALHFAESELHHYDLHAYVVMPNHVHVLVTPLVEPSKFLRTLKSYTAKQANRMLGRTGEPFWQRESYDHVVRNDRERVRIHDYIVNNPVKAGLVTAAEDWRWSSTGRDK